MLRKLIIFTLLLLPCKAWCAFAIADPAAQILISTSGTTLGVCYGFSLIGPDIPNIHGAPEYTVICATPTVVTTTTINATLLANVTNYATQNGFTIPAGNTYLPTYTPK